MSLTFTQRLLKTRKKNPESTTLKNVKKEEDKGRVSTSNRKIHEFQQHHTDLKSMLQLLECEKTNSAFFPPARERKSSKEKLTIQKVKSQEAQNCAKENFKKSEVISTFNFERKLKIRFKHKQEQCYFEEPEKESLLLKNLKYKNKTSRKEEQPPETLCERKESNQSGKRGIPNIGNTCYMNAVLQCLFHLKDFNPGLRSAKHKHSTPITEKYMSLYNGVMNPQETSPDLSTISLKKSVSKICSLFVDFQQEDAHEFLKQLLDSMHEEINRIERRGVYRTIDFTQRKVNLQNLSFEYWNQSKKFDDSYIYDSLCGQVCNFVTCINCNNTSINFDNFLDLSIPMIKGKNSLEELLHDYFAQESLTDFYICSKCNKSSKKSIKRSQLWRCPNYLVIQLKRSQFGKKNSDQIKIPVKCLNMKGFMSSSEKPVAAKYNLQGVVLHRGRIDGGHYWAHIKDGMNWFSVDDESVTSLPMDNVCDQYEIEGSDSAYMLFYRSF